ncbi:hypothetical protein B0H10DRAFT_2439806 [Mycena sp. CBHHK59/15]|nr:hypothetical protein B0H10DRAFT_2439806 [Mycena sp. CBHHK59/15]
MLSAGSGPSYTSYPALVGTTSCSLSLTSVCKTLMLSVSTFGLLLHAVPAGHPFRRVHDDTARAYALDRVPPVRDLYVNVNVNVNVAKGKHQQQNVHHPHPNAQQSQCQHPAPAGGAAELLGAQRDNGWAPRDNSITTIPGT